MRDDLQRDEELQRALRELDQASVASLDDVDRMRARITESATLILDRRRHPPAPWWEYAAIWMRPVAKAAIATVVIAIICIIWAERQSAHGAEPQRRTTMPAASGSQVSAAFVSQQQLLFTLVAPVEQQVLPSMQPVRR